MMASVQPSIDASSNSSARRSCCLGVGIGVWPTHRSAAWHSDCDYEAGGASGSGGPPGKRNGQYRTHQGRDCGAAEIQRIAENAPRWRDVNLAAEYESETPCWGCVAFRYRRAAAMTVLVEPFASVYDDRSLLGVILARGRSGFEAYAASRALRASANSRSCFSRLRACSSSAS